MLFEAAVLLKGFLFQPQWLTGSFLCRSNHCFAVLPANDSVTALVMSEATQPQLKSSERDPIKGIFHKSPGVCVSKLHSVAQPLLTISTSAFKISRLLNPLMSSFFLIHSGRGQRSGTNGALGIGLYSRGAPIIFNAAKGYLVTCCVVLAKSMTNLICTGKLRKIQLCLPDDTSN